MNREKLVVILAIGVLGAALVIFFVQFTQPKIERQGGHVSERTQEHARIEEVDGSDLTEFSESLRDMASREQGITYKVTYEQVSIVSGQEAARGSVTIVQKGDKKKVVTVFPYSSTEVYFLDRVYLCTETYTQKECNVISSTRIPSNQPFEAFSQIADQQGTSVDRSRIVRIADSLAQCFVFGQRETMQWEACYTKDGVPLFFRSQVGDGDDATITTVTATAYTTTVDDRELELPYAL